MLSVKLTDFGIARIIGSPRLTVEDGAVGTPNYLSPEQVEGAPAGPASDIYSLGLVLLECLSGTLAYPGSGFEAAVARLHRAPVLPVDLGPQWAGLLRAMTDRDPGARPDAVHVSAVLADLADLADLAEPAELTRPTADLTWPNRRSRLHVPAATMLLPALPRRRRLGTRGPWLGLAAALAGGIAAVAVVLSRTHDASAPAPVPTSYPSVSGQLGADLDKLEQVIP
jgi:serine/threonine protein kinase